MLLQRRTTEFTTLGYLLFVLSRSRHPSIHLERMGAVIAKAIASDQTELRQFRRLAAEGIYPKSMRVRVRKSHVALNLLVSESGKVRFDDRYFPFRSLQQLLKEFVLPKVSRSASDLGYTPLVPPEEMDAGEKLHWLEDHQDELNQRAEAVADHIILRGSYFVHAVKQLRQLCPHVHGDPAAIVKMQNPEFEARLLQQVKTIDLQILQTILKFNQLTQEARKNKGIGEIYEWIRLRQNNDVVDAQYSVYRIYGQE